MRAKRMAGQGLSVWGPSVNPGPKPSRPALAQGDDYRRDRRGSPGYEPYKRWVGAVEKGIITLSAEQSLTSAGQVLTSARQVLTTARHAWGCYLHNKRGGARLCNLTGRLRDGDQC